MLNTCILPSSRIFYRNGISFTGIVTTVKPVRGALKRLTFTGRNNRPLEFSSDKIGFHIPGFVYLSKYLKVPLNPKDGVIPANIDFERPINDFTRSALRLKSIKIIQFEAAFDLLHAEFSGTGIAAPTVTVEKIASLVFGNEKLEIEHLFAAYLYLQTSYVHYVPTSTPGRYLLRSKSDVENTQTLVDWMRTNATPFKDFVDKAQRALEFSRAHAHPILGTVPADVLKKSDRLPRAFTAADQRFLNFMSEYVTNMQLRGWTPFEVYIPQILKMMKSYSDQKIGPNTATQFLKEVGVWTPWENTVILVHSNLISEHTGTKKAEEYNRKADELTEQFMRTEPFAPGKLAPSSPSSSSSSLLVKSSPKLSPTEFYLRDPCDHLRHDFGALTVYAIDDHTAKEIDDGISIERTADGETWVHIHIADPTAHVSPTSEVARVAAARVQTLYLPDRHYSMLPERMSQQRFSLGARELQYTLTFSARLGADGEIVDIKVRPGVVRNVQTVYYDDADEVLEWANVHGGKLSARRSGPFFAHPAPLPPRVAPEGKPTIGTTAPSPTHRDLLDLQQLSLTHFRNRIRSGGFSFIRPSPFVELQPTPLPTSSQPLVGPTYYSTVPTIQVTLDRWLTSPSRLMIAELMILAGRVAAAFTADRDVPMPYRMQLKPSFAPPDLALLNRALAAQDPLTGLVPFSDTVSVMRLFPSGTVTMLPRAPHWIMGVRDGYTKCTSPLRRYLDLVAHWQIKAGLLGEAAPFSREQLERVAMAAGERERQMSTFSSLATRFWVFELVRRLRAQEKGEWDRREWDAVVTQVEENAYTITSVLLMELGIVARIGSKKEGLKLGQAIKVRIVDLIMVKWVIVVDQV